MRRLIVIALLLAFASPLFAASNLLNNSIANDITLTDGGNWGYAGKVALETDANGNLSGILNYFDLYSGWDVVGHQLDLHDASGNFVQTLATDTNIGWASFVSTDGTDIYTGRTSLGTDTGNHVIEKVAGGGFTHVVDMLYNYDMQFDAGGNAYAVCKDTGTNRIVKVDLTGGSYDAVADVGAGNTAELDFDGSGNLYYVTNGLATDELIRYDAGEIDPSAPGFIVLGLADATKLTDLRYPGGGLAVDEADNVVFSENTGWGAEPERHNLCVIEAGKDYTGYGDYAYDVLSSANAWNANAETVGDVFLYDGDGDDAAFTVAYGGPIAYVPEPASLTLMGIGGLALLRRKRLAR